jgi:hypothetical protein
MALSPPPSLAPPLPRQVSVVTNPYLGVQAYVLDELMILSNQVYVYWYT